MTLSQALMIYTDNKISTRRNEAFKKIATYIADEEANFEHMNSIERDLLYSDKKDDLANLYYKARENML